MSEQMPGCDLPAEREYAAWLAWMRAKGRYFADDSCEAEAFGAGMRAERESPAPGTSASVKDETVLTCLTGTLARLTAVEVRPDHAELTGASNGRGRMTNPAGVARVLFDALREELGGS